MVGTNIPVLVNEIWSTYRQAGITDDLRIIESLAALLLEQEDVLLTDDLPRKAKISVSDESDIRKKHKDASEQAA